jgi:ABC-type glycerol-3-phosphate transport system substrate-binding protein
LIHQWELLHPDNPVTLKELSDEADRAHTDMLQAAQRHDPVDLFNLDVIDVAEFADAGYLRPLDDGTDVTGFLSEPLDTCRYAKKLWCLPFNTDAGLLYYRADLVTNPPDTQAGITDAARAVLTGPAIDPRIVAGYAGQLKGDYEGFTVNALEAIWAAGGEVVDDDGQVVIESPRAQQGLRWLADGTTNQPRVILADPTIEASATQAFADHKVVFLRNWPFWYGTLVPEPNKPRLPVGVAALPASALGGQNLAVGNDSPHPRAAQALLAFLTSERSQQILFERGHFAATREVVYQDDVIRSVDPYAAALLESIKRAHKRPVTPHYQAFSRTFRDVVVYALAHRGQLPDDATERLERALKGY